MVSYLETVNALILHLYASIHNNDEGGGEKITWVVVTRGHLPKGHQWDSIHLVHCQPRSQVI